MKRKLKVCERPEDVDVKRRKPAPRSWILRTLEFVTKAQQMVEQDPRKSIRSLAMELGVANATIHLEVYEDLRYSSYAFEAWPLHMRGHQAEAFGEIPEAAQLVEASRGCQCVEVLLRPEDL